MKDNATGMQENQETVPSDTTLAEIYAFLGLCMRYPQTAFFDDELLDSFESLLDALEWQKEREAVSAWRRASKDPLEDVQIEYTRLFINATGGTPVPPYASVYMDGDRNIQGKTTEKTRDFYRANGYDLAVFSEPADHIHYELEFLAALLHDGKAEAADQFCRTLFLPWFNRFREKCMREARHPFIRVSIQLIDFFTKEEQ